MKHAITHKQSIRVVGCFRFVLARTPIPPPLSKYAQKKGSFSESEVMFETSCRRLRFRAQSWVDENSQKKTDHPELWLTCRSETCFSRTLSSFPGPLRHVNARRSTQSSAFSCNSKSNDPGNDAGVHGTHASQRQVVSTFQMDCAWCDSRSLPLLK